MKTIKCMQKKLRHSKFKNTGILFELLARQITSDIIAGRENSKADKLLLKYFKESTELGKEYQLYTHLLTEKIKDDSHAYRFLDTVLNQRKKLNKKLLAQQKYDLIKEIKENYPIDSFFKTNLRNYRLLASIYKIFEDSSTSDIKFGIPELCQAKNCILENIVNKPKPLVTETNDDLKYYEEQDEETRLLAYKFLVEEYNKKYSILDEEQKQILREYICNVANTNSLGLFMKTKISDVKSQLKTLCEQVDSDVMKIKIQEVSKQLDKLNIGEVVKDNQVTVLLLSYELLKEVKNCLSSKKDII